MVNAVVLLTTNAIKLTDSNRVGLMSLKGRRSCDPIIVRVFFSI